MTSKNQLPKNTFLISKDSQVGRLSHFIDLALDRYTEVELRCAGTAIQKAILISQKCVSSGFAEYSRFKSRLVPHQGKQIIYTIIKLKRAIQDTRKKQSQNKEQKPTEKSFTQQKRPQGNQGSNNNERNTRKQGNNNRQQERNKRQVYNDDHRQRNERRKQQNYKQSNRGQRNEDRNTHDREFR